MSNLSGFSRLNNLFMLGAHGEIGRINDQGAFVFDLILTRRFAAYAPAFLKECDARPDDGRFRIGIIYRSREQKPWGTETLLFNDSIVHLLYPVSGAKNTGLTAFQQRKRENSIYYGLELLLNYSLKDCPGVPIFLPILFERGVPLRDYTAMAPDTLAKEDPDAPVIEVLNLIGPPASSRNDTEVFSSLQEQLRRAVVKRDARKSIEAKIMESMKASAAPQKNETPFRMNEPTTQPSIPATAPGTPLSTAAPTSSANTASPHWYDAALHEPICDHLQPFLRAGEHPEIQQVRRFLPFQRLDSAQQQTLAERCPVYTAPSGSMLLERGTTDRWNLYLLQGELELIAADGEKKIVSGEADNARNAIAALKPRKYAVTARSRVRFLWIHDRIVDNIEKSRTSGYGLL